MPHDKQAARPRTAPPQHRGVRPEDVPLLTSHSAWQPECKFASVASRLAAALCMGGWPSSSIVTSPGRTPPCITALSFTRMGPELWALGIPHANVQPAP